MDDASRQRGQPGEPHGPSTRGSRSEVAAVIAAWRERGVDPVRLRFIEALARRATAHRGEARRLLDDRVARLLAGCADDVARAGPSGDGSQSTRSPAPRTTPLSQLLAHIARHAEAHDPSGDGGADGPAIDALPELRALREFRRIGSRIAADRRLIEALSTIPQRPGPLNSQLLVHRTLAAMRALSPAYFERFVMYVDGLMGLEEASGKDRSPASGTAERKASRGARRRRMA